MSKVTSKLQVTIPKVIAEQTGISPGDEVDWVIAGESVRMIPARIRIPAQVAVADRLRCFDAATERQRHRQAGREAFLPAEVRGWTREELYTRGRPG